MNLNKQKIDEIKYKIKNIREKLTNTNKEKVPKKYYALLILMLLLGIMTLSNNIKEYNNSNQEQYKEYELDKKEAASQSVKLENYQTAESSISTTESNLIIEEAVETISNNNEAVRTKYIMPVDGEIIKSYATEKLVYSETLGMWKIHPGIDIKAEFGAYVKSSSDGVIKVIEKDSFYGNSIKIISNAGYVFVYSNLDDPISLREGDEVKQGEIIGRVGVSAAGELADKSHLHFEIIKDEIQVNPLDLIN